MISKDIAIEDLIDTIPGSVNFLATHGIRCIMCGEPIWGTLYEACIDKGFSEEKIDNIVSEINKI